MESGTNITFRKTGGSLLKGPEMDKPTRGVLVFPISINNVMVIGIRQDGEDVVFRTSPVKALTRHPHVDNLYTIETRNSTYEVRFEGSEYDDASAHPAASY